MRKRSDIVDLLKYYLEGKRLDKEELKELEKFLIGQLDMVRKEKALK